MTTPDAHKMLTRSDLTDSQREKMSVRVIERLETLERFVEREARAVPKGLIHPLARNEYLALSPDERRAKLRERVREQLIESTLERLNAALAEKSATLAAKAEAAAAASASTPPAHRPGVLLAISDVSGDWLPITEIRREEVSARVARRDERRRNRERRRLAA